MKQKINYDELLVGIDSKVQTLDKGKIRSINFDNAATTPPFRTVIETITGLSNYYASIGRGAGQKAEITTRIYSESRNYLLDFFNIKNKNKYTVVYVGNTTDGINKLSRILIKNKNDVVISTRMEHHSNDLPWRRRCKVDYIEVDSLGRLLIDQLESKLIKYNGKVKYVTVVGASNVTGYINDIHKIARIAHKYKAKIIVDGAQLVPHVKVDIEGQNDEEAIDFLVFSAHKLYAPFGSGAIIGLREEFKNKYPDNEGGGTVVYVGDKCLEYLDPPEKDEGGTPNYFGVIAMITALEELNRIGYKAINKNELDLKSRLLDGLSKIPNIKTYGDVSGLTDSVGIVVFNIENIDHQKVAEILAKSYGVSVRQGWFCAHPYCRRIMGLNEKMASKFLLDKTISMPGMIRVSFGIYNNQNEVDYFLEAIESIGAMAN